MNRTQQGRVGELALALYAMVSTDGALELFTPVSDSDHVDVTAGRHGGIPAIAVQVKTTPRLDGNGTVEARAVYAKGHLREHPAFLYVVLLMSSIAIEHAWVVPSPDFNRLAYDIEDGKTEVLEFHAYADREDKWTPYQVAAMDIGPHLLGVIDSLTETIPPDFLAEAPGLVLARRAP